MKKVPPKKHSQALQSFDNAFRDCFESYLCTPITDCEWLLASLTTKMGGLGLWSTETHIASSHLKLIVLIFVKSLKQIIFRTLATQNATAIYHL